METVKGFFSETMAVTVYNGWVAEGLTLCCVGKTVYQIPDIPSRQE